MKFLVPNYSCLQNPWLGSYRPQIPVLSVLRSQLNLLNPLPEKNSWVRHWMQYRVGLCLAILWSDLSMDWFQKTMAIIMYTELTLLNLFVGGESMCFHHWVHLSLPCCMMHPVLLPVMIWFRGAQLVDSYQIRCYKHQPIHTCLWCSLICFGTQCVDMFL
jgi:hypothetical protein